MGHQVEARIRCGRNTLCVIERAHREPKVREGGIVEFKGEYEWTEEGGVVHWTHVSGGHRHENSYIIHNGEKYQ